MSSGEKLAKKYIPQLYNILRNEHKLSPEDSYAKVQQDCDKIWAEDTVRKHIPDEAKNVIKRKAGKISSGIKKQRKNESLDLNMNNAGQCSVVRGTDSADVSAGSNPTENGSVGRKEQGLRPEGTDKRSNYCAGCNEKNSSLNELQEELDIRNFEILSLQREVDDLKRNKGSSEVIVEFSVPMHFGELRSQMEHIFKITDGTGNVWLNGKFDTKTMKIIELSASAAPSSRTSDPLS